MAFAKKDRNISLSVYLMFILGLFLIGFIFYIVASNQKYFDKKYSIYMFLPNAQGLNSGAFVALSGLKIGVVGKMKINLEKEHPGIITELKIDRKYADYICSSSIAMIKTMGILGDKYVDITIGSPDDIPLHEGDFIKSDPGVDPYEFIDDAAELVTGLKSVLFNVDSLTSQANSGRGVVGKLFRDPVSEKRFTNLMVNLNEISGNMVSGKGTAGMLLNDPGLYTNLKKSSQNFHAITDSIVNGRGTFAQMLADTAFYPKLKAITSKTDSLLYKLHNHGTAARLLNDEQLYENLVSLVRSLDSLSTDLKKNPGRYVQVKVF